jgi:hypothetical protein
LAMQHSTALHFASLLSAIHLPRSTAPELHPKVPAMSVTPSPDRAQALPERSSRHNPKLTRPPHLATPYQQHRDCSRTQQCITQNRAFQLPQRQHKHHLSTIKESRPRSTNHQRPQDGTNLNDATEWKVSNLRAQLLDIRLNVLGEQRQIFNFALRRPNFDNHDVPPR